MNGAKEAKKKQEKVLKKNEEVSQRIHEFLREKNSSDRDLRLQFRTGIADEVSRDKYGDVISYDKEKNAFLIVINGTTIAEYVSPANPNVHFINIGQAMRENPSQPNHQFVSGTNPLSQIFEIAFAQGTIQAGDRVVITNRHGVVVARRGDRLIVEFDGGSQNLREIQPVELQFAQFEHSNPNMRRTDFKSQVVSRYEERLQERFLEFNVLTDHDIQVDLPKFKKDHQAIYDRITLLTATKQDFDLANLYHFKVDLMEELYEAIARLNDACVTKLDSILRSYQFTTEIRSSGGLYPHRYIEFKMPHGISFALFDESFDRLVFDPIYYFSPHIDDPKTHYLTFGDFINMFFQIGAGL